MALEVRSGDRSVSMPTGEAGGVQVSPSAPVVSVAPVVLSAPGRAVDLDVRVSAPVTGRELPVILLSHGHGNSNYLSSLLGCAPLADFWAAHGFVVLQPTHLDSTTLSRSVDPNDPEGPLFWRSRGEDMKRILDQLDRIEASVPELSGRLDRSRIAAVGYSLGGHTAAMLLGARLADPKDGTEVDMADSRIKAGVLIAPPGRGGADLSAFAAEHYPFLLHPSFGQMTTPALVVTGDKDVSPRFTARGADWRADAYFLSSGPKCLLTLFGAEHSFGGISGYDAAETTDENPERLAAVQRLTWAYLRTALYPEDPAWPAACAALMDSPNPLGRVESK